MSKFKEYFIYDCISFTILTILSVFLNYLNILSELDSKSIIIYFTMTSIICLLIFFTDKLPINNTLIIISIDMINVILTVFIVGILNNLFRLNLCNIFIIVCMAFIVYFGVFSITLIKNYVDVDSINKKIKHEED